MNRAWKKLGLAGLASAAFACGSGEERAKPTAPLPTAAQPAPAAAKSSEAIGTEAKQLFETRCYTCHGMTGVGDGPGSAALTPKPRNFTDPTWQASVTDDHIDKIIRYGGSAVGRSPMMPGNPDLIAKPEIVAALVQYVRSLGKSP